MRGIEFPRMPSERSAMTQRTTGYSLREVPGDLLRRQQRDLERALKRSPGDPTRVREMLRDVLKEKLTRKLAAKMGGREKVEGDLGIDDARRVMKYARREWGKEVLKAVFLWRHRLFLWSSIPEKIKLRIEVARDELTRRKAYLQVALENKLVTDFEARVAREAARRERGDPPMRRTGLDE